MNGLRTVLWRLGSPVRALLLAGIGFYRAVLSGWMGGQCRFAPTCSHYADEAIRRFGATKGSLMAIWRVLRCNPYGKGGFDPLPHNRDVEYDMVLQAERSPETGLRP